MPSASVPTPPVRMWNDALIAGVKQAAPEVAVLCNTGCRPDTIARKLP